MRHLTRHLQRFLVALTVALVLVGLGAELASAEILPAGKPGSKASERKYCTDHGGVYTTEHDGNVGICTWPDGGQSRCSFRAKKCTVSVREVVLDDSTGVDVGPSVASDAVEVTPEPEQLDASPQVELEAAGSAAEPDQTHRGGSAKSHKVSQDEELW